MADLFQTSRTNVVEHIKHIYDEGELDENLTCRKFRMLSEDKLVIGGNDDLNDYCKREKESYTVDRHGHMIIYQTEDGLTKIDANIQDDTVWLSLSQMADLFQKDKSTISRHIRNIFKEGELLQTVKSIRLLIIILM
jgi:hypothetical protein